MGLELGWGLGLGLRLGFGFGLVGVGLLQSAVPLAQPRRPLATVRARLRVRARV